MTSNEGIRMHSSMLHRTRDFSMGRKGCKSDMREGLGASVHLPGDGIAAMLYAGIESMTSFPSRCRLKSPCMGQ